MPPTRGGTASSRSHRRGRRRGRLRTSPRSPAPRPSPGVGADQPGRRGRPAEDPADRRRVEAARVEEARRRCADACDHLVAGDDRGQQLGAGRALRLGGRERRRAHDHADVRDRVGVRVVEVEPVAEHPVRERGVRRGQRAVEADHRRLGLAAELGHCRAALPGDPEGRCCVPAADRVQEVQLRVLGDVLRDVAGGQVRRPFGDRLCSGHSTLQSVSVPGTRARPRAHRACRP